MFEEEIKPADSVSQFAFRNIGTCPRSPFVVHVDFFELNVSEKAMERSLPRSSSIRL
jgi:hypothetical protein